MERIKFNHKKILAKFINASDRFFIGPYPVGWSINHMVASKLPPHTYKDPRNYQNYLNQIRYKIERLTKDPKKVK